MKMPIIEMEFWFIAERSWCFGVRKEENVNRRNQTKFTDISI